MWSLVGKWILKNPWIILIFVLLTANGVQWTKNVSLKGDLADAQTKISNIQSDYDTCKLNENTLNGAINSCNGEISEFVDSIDLLSEQVRKEKDRVVYWRNKYNNKICLQPQDEVCVNPEEKGVLNDEKNVDVINRINDIFTE